MSTIKDLRDIIRAGGSTEGETGSKGINNLQIFTRDDGKQTLYPNLESAPSSSGGASIVLNAETGDITVTVPKKWKDDERVKSFTDNYNLKILSGNYKNNKDAVYASPFDETKQVKAEEWVKEMDEALKSRISALNTEGPAKADVISAFGGTDKKNSAIQSMNTDNIIVMSLNPKEDKDWLPIPKYMLEAYPQIKKLSTFSTNSNGNFVQKKDFMDNLYNIEDGKITEREALGIATAPSRVLEKIEDLDPEEIASTIAFGNFIKSVDPKRSNWQQFLQAGSAMYEGLQAGLYDWAVGTTDLIANAANFSWLNGNTVSTRDFWDFAFGRRNGMDYDSVSDVFSEHASQMAATNKDALNKAKIAYVEGSIAGKAFDTIVSLILVGKGTEFLSSKLTPKIIEKGSAKVASDINEAAAYKTTVETLANRGGVFARQAQNMNNMYGGLATNAQAQASILTDINARNSAIYSAYKSYSASAKYKMFFSQTVDQAIELYTKALGGTTALLQSLGPAQLASVVNSASKIAMSATLADTAISVLGSLVLSAVVGNKDLTTKVLSGKGTSDDAKILLGESAWLTLKGYAFLGLTNVAPAVRKAFFNKYPGLEEAFNNLSDAASQKFMKFTDSIAHPWQKFIKWYLDRQTAIARAKKAVLPNRKVASAEAIKEQALLAEARQYGSNLSREKGSNGVKIVNDAFEKIFGESLITGNEQAELTQAQKIDALAKAGVLFTSKELSMSEFEAWRPSYLALQNDLNSWSDIQTNVSQVVKEFSNPNIEPVISQQLSELNNINARLLDLEKEAGLLSKIEIGANKRLLKNDSGFIYAYHSKESAVYAVRSYEYKVLVNEAISKGINPVEYTPAIEAYQRLAESAQKLPEQIREIISKEYIPALSSVEKLIVDRMIDPSIAVYPSAFVMDMRADGKYGKDGNDWLRLVARKELPKGVYNPFSKVVERDNTIALSNFKILDDNDITWVGNGLSELITEYGMARAEKQLLEDAKAATGLTTNEIISGNKTASVRKINEYKSNLKKSINEGVKSFVETSKGTVAIGKERARVQSEFYEQISVTGGIASIDIASLRVVLEEKGIASATSITDQQSFEKFYDGCDQYAKDIIDKAIGERGSGLTKQAPTNFGEYSEFDNLIYDRESWIEYSKTLDNQKQDLLSIRASREENGEPVDDIDKALSDLEEKISVNNDTIKSIEDKMLNEENWPEFWKRASKEVKDVIRNQLKSTSLQTGYGIKGQIIERLNAQVPGFNILDWSLLNREHTNGLVNGGLYSGMDDIEVKAYIFDIDDLADLMGLNLSTADTELIRTIGSYQNTLNGSAVLPIDVENTSKVFNFGGRVNVTNDQTANWGGYLANLKENGVEKVPVVIKREHPPKSKSMSIDKILEKRGKAPQDITTQLQDAFASYSKIPFFHGQNDPYGSIKFNNKMAAPQGEDRYDANNGIGDAYWLSPNADYTTPYGDTQIAGNIPTKYFMSDKERVKTLEDIMGKLAEYDKKISDIGKEEIEKSIKPVGKTRFTEKEWNKDGLASKGFFVIMVNGKATYVDLSGTVYGSQPSKTKGVKYLAPTDKKVKLPENFVEKHIVDTEGYKDLGRKKLSRSEKNELTKLEKIFLPNGDVSYRALAEYAKKPVIDISIPMQNMPGVRADGTAFFYYKGVSPKFDEEIGEQLLAQKKATSEFVDIPGMSDGAKNIILENRGLSLENLIENATMGEGLSEEWNNMVSAAEFNGATFTKEKISKEFEEGLANIKKYAPSWGEAIEKVWSANEPTLDLESIEVNLEDLGAKYTDVLDEDVETYNSTLNPRYNNVGSDIKYRPTKDISYEDFKASLDVGGEAARAELYKAIDEQRFNNLTNLKQSSPDKYEKLLEQVDRANSANNDAVRNSMPVQAAAEEYRKNVTEFENSVVLSNRLSYLTKSVVPKGSLLEFAKNNDIPTGKNIKSDVKEALWNKLLNGESLPEIKDLHIKNIEKDIATYRSVDGKVVNPSEEAQEINEALLKDIQNKFYEALEKTDLFKNYSGPNALKYEVDLPKISSDIDNAIDDMIDRVLMDKESRLALEGMAQYYDVKPTRVRSEFYVLGELLAKSNNKNLDNLLKELSREVVNGLVPPNMVIIQGNIKNITKDIENILRDKLESRFAMAKTQLQTLGENVNSDAVDELLEKYMADLKLAKADPLVVKTTNSDGEIVYEKVSPVIADLYKNRPVYTPMSTPMQILSDFALLKKIFTTDLSPKSFAKQSVSDPALAYVTTGALPGTLQALRSELAAQFGDILQYMPSEDPRRFEIIKQIADRDGISLEEALMQNMIAKASVEIPFTLLNNEILRQANASKYGNKAAIDAQRRTAAQAMNDGLRKVSDKFGTPQNIREQYPRVYSGVKAKVDALNRGYSLAQAEAFETYAINNATTNFRQKHTVFNGLRSTVPFLTSGISGAKSFWKMFELDPIGVTSRIFTGFIVPILFFTGEIMSSDDLRKKYKDLAENEKNNHIVIAVAGELVAIPVGEELGQYVNIARHVVEKMYDANRFSFYNLMLNDIVNLLPAGDLTGFTDPEMWEPLSGQAPSFLEVIENGTGRMLASTAPPLIQTIFMANTGRDLYTGKKINTGYVTIDEDGNSTIMSYSTSQFAKALANLVGGDPRVIEKITSGAGGTVLLGVLDTITSAVQFFVSGGQEGSLTTGVEKALSDLSKPFALVGYDSLEKRFNSELSKLWDEKEKIISSEEYAAYNKEISMDKNPESRRKKIAKRNDLFNEFQKRVAKLVAGYRDAGGTLDKWKLSKVTSLVTFEDAVRADRTFMHLNTEYSDAYKQAMQTLYDMGITNPDGISSLGYIYTDNAGNPQLTMWNPVQMQIIQRAMSEQGDIHAAHIEAIINDGTENSLYKQYKKSVAEQQPYWDKYYATGKLSDAEWDKIDELKKEFNEKVVLGLMNYMNSYGAANVLSHDEVVQYLKGIIQVPSSYETVKGRYISSGNGKVDKEGAFIESYLKQIFGVRNYGK